MSETSAPSTQESREALSSLEPHGERRRRQLIRAAAHVIEFEGIDALRMPRVAELAGCTRTLVYRYFPSRDDLICAVAAEYYETLAAGFDREARRQLTQDVRPGRDALDESIEKVKIVFETVAELGLAGLLVRSSPSLAQVTREKVGALADDLAERWTAPMQRAGLDDIHVGILSSAGAAVLVDVVQRWQRDEISRETALDLTCTAFRSLIEGYAGRSR